MQANRPAAPGKGEVWVWQAQLAAGRERLDVLQSLLGPGECERAASFAFERDRQRFVASHGILREILGHCLGAEPSHLAFENGPHGKPRLSGTCLAGDLRFNMSHSEDVALYALARGCEVGIDVEVIRQDLEVQELARQFLSASEAAALDALPESERPAGFVDFWVLKEAWSKAMGCGLSISPVQFEVAGLRSRVPKTVSAQFGSQGTRTWSLQLLDAGPGYSAALAVEGQCRSVRQWEWR